MGKGELLDENINLLPIENSRQSNLQICNIDSNGLLTNICTFLSNENIVTSKAKHSVSFGKVLFSVFSFQIFLKASTSELAQKHLCFCFIVLFFV